MSAGGDSRAAWDAFWSASNKSGSGCLPDAVHGIDRVQTEVWRRFAQDLPQAARVLDLGTGDGRVMARLLQACADLTPIGIDQASRLPPPPPGAEMRAGVSMVSLPFADAEFAAATSQFAFEYADPEPAAAELARVLVPGGKVTLISHREDSVIVTHNMARLDAIRWVLDEQDLPSLAMQDLQATGSMSATIANAPEEGARRFGTQSAAWEIAEAMRRTLHFGRNDPVERTAATIAQIAAQARGEMGRLVSLEAAARNAGTGEKLAAVLEGAGMQVDALEALYDGVAQQPFASLIVLTRTA